MKSGLELFQEESLKIKLALEERSLLRASLIAYIDQHPVTESSSSFQNFAGGGMVSLNDH